MGKPTDSELSAPRRIPFVETESGMLAGMWHYPVEGFAWRSDVEPLATFLGTTDRGRQDQDPGPWLVPVGATARRYAPLRRAGLLEAVDRLAADPTPERIKSFADHWGNLGFAQTLTPRFTAGGRRTISMDGAHHGESLNQWGNAVRQFGELRHLWRAVQVLAQEDSWGPQVVRAARAHLRDRITWSPDGTCDYDSRYEAGGAWSEWHEWIYNPMSTEADVVAAHLAGRNDYEAARYYVHRKVNEQLRGSVSPAVLPYLRGAIRFFPATLMAAVWLRFAMELSGATGRQRECEYCRTPFLQTRRDRRFCAKACQEASAYHRRAAARGSR